MTGTMPEKRLKEYLLSHGSACGISASDAEISQFESQNMTTIPDDLRSYFRSVNGTAGDYAYGIVRFWSLDEVQTVAHELAAKQKSTALIHSRYAAPVPGAEALFVFADYMHESQLYAIKLSQSERVNPVFLFDGGDPVEIAKSFTDFVDQYLSNPEDLRLMVD